MTTTVGGIHGQILEVTVIGCNKLKNTELFTRQDPYVCLDYGESRFRTKTCTDGGKNPTFDEKFQITLIEGLREISIEVWNSNTFRKDDFIGSGRVQLEKVLLQGYDDSTRTLNTRTSSFAGDVKLIMHYSNPLQKTSLSCAYQYPPPSPAPYPHHLPSPAASYQYPGSVYPPLSVQQTCYPPPPVYPPQPYQQQYTPPYHPPGNHNGWYPQRLY